MSVRREILTIKLSRHVAMTRGLSHPLFAMRRHEERFVSRLLSDRTNLWLFRCNQRRFCGDFVIVDMSGGGPTERRIHPIELKQRTPLKVGGRHLQMSNHPAAVCEIAVTTRAIDPTSLVVPLFGGPNEVAAYLRA